MTLEIKYIIFYYKWVTVHVHVIIHFFESSCLDRHERQGLHIKASNQQLITTSFSPTKSQFWRPEKHYEQSLTYIHKQLTHLPVLPDRHISPNTCKYVDNHKAKCFYFVAFPILLFNQSRKLERNINNKKNHFAINKLSFCYIIFIRRLDRL